MSIITWVENGQKQFAVFDSRHFESGADDFPVYECQHSHLKSILLCSEDRILLVSEDRKRYRMLEPQTKKMTASPRPIRRRRKSA